LTAHPDKRLRLKGLLSTCGKIAVEARVKPHDRVKLSVGGQINAKDYHETKELLNNCGIGLKLKYDLWWWSYKDNLII